MDKLLSIVNDGTGIAVGFADDGAFLIAGPDLGTLILCMQQKLNKALNGAVTVDWNYQKKKLSTWYLESLAHPNGGAALNTN